MPLSDEPAEHRPLAAPGGSGPQDPAYGGEATIGDEGAAAGPESFVDPTAAEEEAEAAVSPEVRERWARAEGGAGGKTDAEG